MYLTWVDPSVTLASLLTAIKLMVGLSAGCCLTCQWRNLLSHLEPVAAVRHARCSCIELGRSQLQCRHVCMSLYSPVQGQSITILLCCFSIIYYLPCGFITFTVVNVQGGKHPHASEHLGAASSLVLIITNGFIFTHVCSGDLHRSRGRRHLPTSVQS